MSRLQICRSCQHITEVTIYLKSCPKCGSNYVVTEKTVDDEIDYWKDLKMYFHHHKYHINPNQTTSSEGDGNEKN